MFRELLGRLARSDDTVSICIPAWQSESFIERTLHCAAMQTHKSLQILVSVDHSEDATGVICESFARKDSRVSVFIQRERLGWARNVNFLLERVRSPFFFLYFHDDLIDPDYTRRLLKTLSKYPDAMSCHCDMGHFGGSDYVSQGRTYTGSAAQRLATFLVTPTRGSPLRSLTRSAALGKNLRLPTNAIGGFWANEPYLMRLVAAGPAIRVPKILYRRWDQRKDGLTDGWKGLVPAQVLSGFRANIATALDIIDQVVSSSSEREVLVFCLYVNMMVRVRNVDPIIPAEDLNPAFIGKKDLPSSLGDFGPKITKWALQRYRHLQSLEQRGAR